VTIMANVKHPITSENSVKKIGETIRGFLFARSGGGGTEQSKDGSAVSLQDAASSGPANSSDSGRNHNLVSAARVQLLGLDLIREQLGAEWEKFGEKAKGHIERTLSQRLSQVDMFECVGELRYAIVFASLPEDEAKAKIALIASEIWRKLFGDAEPPRGVAIDTVVIQVDGSTRVGAIVDLIDDQQPADSNFADRPDRQPPAGGLSKQGNRTAELTLRQQSPTWQATYRPIWDVEKEVVVAFRFTPMATSESGEVLIDHEAIVELQPGTNIRRRFARADRLFIQSVSDGLKHEGRRPSRCLIICPVHYETFATRDDQRIFLGLIRELPQSFRADLILELVGVPEGSPQARLVQIVPALKHLVRDVYCRAWDNLWWFSDLAESGIAAVGFDVGELALSEKSVFERMPRFAAAVSNSGLRSYAMGIDRLSLATHAVCSGLSYVAGDAIMASTSKIEYVFRYGPRDLVYPLARSHGKGC
jgi:hypothetical protein